MRYPCIALLSAIVSGAALAATAIAGDNNLVVADGFVRAIHENDKLSDSQKRVLVDAVDEIIKSERDLGADRKANAYEHLRAYLPAIAGGAAVMTDQQFEVVGRTLRLALKNYSVVPPITDAERVTARRSLAAVKEGIQMFVNSTYSDTPESVRNDLIASVTERNFSELERRVGNYFFPHLVYSTGKSVTSDDVASAFRASPFLTDNSKAFASTAEIQADVSLPEASRQVHIGFFVNNETAKIAGALGSVTSGLFDVRKLSRVQGYSQPDRDLIEAQNRLAAELHDVGLHRGLEAVERAKHEKEMRVLLEGTGLLYADGAVQGPEGGFKSAYGPEPAENTESRMSTLSWRVYSLLLGGALLAVVGIARFASRRCHSNQVNEQRAVARSDT